MAALYRFRNIRIVRLVIEDIKNYVDALDQELLGLLEKGEIDFDTPEGMAGKDPEIIRSKFGKFFKQASSESHLDYTHRIRDEVNKRLYELRDAIINRLDIRLVKPEPQPIVDRSPVNRERKVAENVETSNEVIDEELPKWMSIRDRPDRKLP